MMNRPEVLFLVCALSLLTAVLRFTVPGHGFSWPGTYEAMAHVLVGGLLGVWLADVRANKFYLWVALGITAVEVVAFLAK